jgi:hypothetical protein
MKQRFEAQEYVLGPTPYDRGPPIWRYRKTLTAEDGEVRHLLEMPGNPGQEIVVKDDEITLIQGRRFFSWGNLVYHVHDHCVKPRLFCSVGDHLSDCSAVATRVAEFLDKGGDAWSREFHALSAGGQ